MAKQVKIKDIAQMAGVSAGTVDRILHNRGNVSAKSREAVQNVLEKVGYKYNIHASAISFRKKFNIGICIPTAEKGEYWGAIMEGFKHALEEYSDIDISCRYFFYNQFDIYSCKEAFEKIIHHNADAVILGPTFVKETIRVCKQLDKKRIPYVFVDSTIEDASPYETYTTDQHACGYLLGKLLDIMTPNDSSLAIFRIQHVGNQYANNSSEREKGFEDYMKDSGKNDKLIKVSFSISNPEETMTMLPEFLKSNPTIKGLAVPNSRGYIPAEILKHNNISDIKIISFDLTGNNRKYLEEGYISALLCQKPEQQGFYAIKSIINRLLYNMPSENVHHLMPIDIIFKENLPYYKEI